MYYISLSTKEKRRCVFNIKRIYMQTVGDNKHLKQINLPFILNTVYVSSHFLIFFCVSIDNNEGMDIQFIIKWFI